MNSKPKRPAQARQKEELIFDHDGAVDVEAMREERVGASPQYTAPGAELKWRARDLVDIHWNLTGIKTPSESYNRIMSCIIGHANPNTGCCYPKQRLIAAETGYSRDTVSRAVKWWVANKFLVVESRGIGHANAYHPQWALFDVFYAAVAHDIAAQKEAWGHHGNQSAPCSTKVQHASSTYVQHGESHHAATHESQSRNLKG